MLNCYRRLSLSYCLITWNHLVQPDFLITKIFNSTRCSATNSSENSHLLKQTRTTITAFFLFKGINFSFCYLPPSPAPDEKIELFLLTVCLLSSNRGGERLQAKTIMVENKYVMEKMNTMCESNKLWSQQDNILSEDFRHKQASMLNLFQKWS